uniref:PH01B001G05.1 protein n=1 Tax=Phyllostachys edulis TaxID=38705 RepID=L0P3L5_PHYED|nr:PH01B001G05.1 [Phyllostachys edulis]
MGEWRQLPRRAMGWGSTDTAAGEGGDQEVKERGAARGVGIRMVAGEKRGDGGVAALAEKGDGVGKHRRGGKQLLLLMDKKYIKLICYRKHNNAS